MINIKVDKDLYEIPEVFDIDKFVAIYKLDINEEINWNRIIKVAIDGISEDIINKMNYDMKYMIISFIIVNMNKRVETKIIDLDKLSFGEFIDLEVYLSLGYINYLKEMMKILSPYTKTGNGALWVLEKWMEWRNLVYRQYRGLFDADKEVDERDLKHIEKDKMIVARTWYGTLVELSGEDILKMEEIENLPFRRVFNFMSYKKDKRKEEELQAKKRQRALELQQKRR